jgi:hypothetical protein
MSAAYRGICRVIDGLLCQIGAAGWASKDIELLLFSRVWRNAGAASWIKSPGP